MPTRPALQTFSCRLHSNAAEVAALADALAGWAKGCGMHARTVNYLGLMLDELVSNIVRHAYAGRHDGSIEIAAHCDGSAVCVTLRDEGPAFDPTQLAPADTEQGMDEREFGGLGVHFVRRIADRFSYRRDGTANETVFCKQNMPLADKNHD